MYAYDELDRTLINERVEEFRDQVKRRLAGEPIQYKFDPTVDKVTDLWTEWSLGLGPGPSIQQLDSVWGAKWRDQTERPFYKWPADNQGYPAAACVRPS